MGLLKSHINSINGLFVISEDDCDPTFSRPALGGVTQNVDVAEDTEVTTTMIAFNSEPLDFSSNFPSGPFDYESINYTSYGVFCETHDCLK